MTRRHSSDRFYTESKSNSWDIATRMRLAPTGGLTKHVRLPPPQTPTVKTDAQLAQLVGSAAIHPGAHAIPAPKKLARHIPRR